MRRKTNDSSSAISLFVVWYNPLYGEISSLTLINFGYTHHFSGDAAAAFLSCSIKFCAPGNRGKQGDKSEPSCLDNTKGGGLGWLFAGTTLLIPISIPVSIGRLKRTQTKVKEKKNTKKATHRSWQDSSFLRTIARINAMRNGSMQIGHRAVRLSKRRFDGVGLRAINTTAASGWEDNALKGVRIARLEVIAKKLGKRNCLPVV